MEELRWQVDDLRTDLDRPIVAGAYRGLFDAAGAATAAVTWMADRFDAAVIGDGDPETFYDFTQERPVVEFDFEGVRRLRWPANEVLVAHGGAAPRDLVLMSGVEPHLRSRAGSEPAVPVELLPSGSGASMRWRRLRCSRAQRCSEMSTRSWSATTAAPPDLPSL